MEKYLAMAIVRIGAGTMLGLTDADAKDRMLNLEAVDGADAPEDGYTVYRATAPLQFKVGQEFYAPAGTFGRSSDVVSDSSGGEPAPSDPVSPVTKGTPVEETAEEPAPKPKAKRKAAAKKK